jgi:hypothetical protein
MFAIFAFIAATAEDGTTATALRSTCTSAGATMAVGACSFLAPASFGFVKGTNIRVM